MRRSCCHSSGVSMAGGPEEGRNLRLQSGAGEVVEAAESGARVCRYGAGEITESRRRPRSAGGVCGAGVGRRLSLDFIFPSLSSLLALLPSPLLTSYVLPVREPHLPIPRLCKQCCCRRRPQASHHLRLIAYRTPQLQNRTWRTRRSTGRAVVE